MIWKIQPKEGKIKTCFALFPKRIGDCGLWLHKYYKTWDYYHQGSYSGYIPHWFVNKVAIEKYVAEKKEYH